MLPSQRDQFDVPRDCCYLNAASWSPLPHAVQQAGHAGVDRKARPWLIDPGFAAEQHARARRAAATLIGADAADIALIPSISYGVAVVGKAFSPPRGTRVVLIADDHSSPMLEWMTRAEAQGFSVDIAPTPADGDWTSALLAVIDKPGAAPVSLASISSVHWADGGVVDVLRVRDALRRQGAALLVDATHGAGVMPLDVAQLDPDFLVFPTYKWVLGPYGRAFLYIAKRRQEALPLEQTPFSRRAIASETTPYFADMRMAEGAKRFDMGERDHLISLDMASTGMELMARWGQAAIAARLQMLTDRLAAGLQDGPVRFHAAQFRTPHLLSLEFPQGMPAGLVEALAAEQVYAAPRLGRLRLSPHVYNDEADVDRFLSVFHHVMRTA